MIGRGSHIVAHYSIDIGDNVYTGPYVYITDQNHSYADPDQPIGRQWPVNSSVKIGAGTWLGTGVIVLPGSSIGRNVVVAAGSVVRGEIPDLCVVAGVPARVVKDFSPEVRLDEAAAAGAQSATGRWAAATGSGGVGTELVEPAVGQYAAVSLACGACPGCEPGSAGLRPYRVRALRLVGDRAPGRGWTHRPAAGRLPDEHLAVQCPFHQVGRHGGGGEPPSFVAVRSEHRLDRARRQVRAEFGAGGAVAVAGAVYAGV